MLSLYTRAAAELSSPFAGYFPDPGVKDKCPLLLRFLFWVYRIWQQPFWCHGKASTRGSLDHAVNFLHFSVSLLSTSRLVLLKHLQGPTSQGITWPYSINGHRGKWERQGTCLNLLVGMPTSRVGVWRALQMSVQGSTGFFNKNRSKTTFRFQLKTRCAF